MMSGILAVNAGVHIHEGAIRTDFPTHCLQQINNKEGPT